MQPLRIKSGLNVSQGEILSNIEANIENPWLDRALGEGAIALVGGGPSLAHYVDKIASLQASSAKVMALNGAHDYLLERGVTPDFASLVDARKENAGFYSNPSSKTHYLIASQAHPDVFRALKGQKVSVWHSALGENVRDIYRVQAKAKSIGNFIEIGGGCTVGLRACYLAYACGFTDLHLFGYDSSHAEYHHAYRQDINDGQDVIEVEVAGEKFRTSPTMAKQAYQFQSVVMRLSRAGVEITVHGGGLLPAIHKEMHRPIPEGDLEATEARKYCNMWAFDEYRQNAPGERHVLQAVAGMEMKQGSSLIDFGCGTGRGAQMFKDAGYKVLGVDFAANCLDENIDIDFTVSCLWDLPDVSADYGYCTDVMEHIPPEKIDDVLSSISGCVRKCFFNIHTAEDSMGQLIEDELHLSVHPPEWWIDKLGEHFSVVRQLHDTAHENSVILIGENYA